MYLTRGNTNKIVHIST